MFELEPGPFAFLARDEPRPFPPRPSFEGLVADRLGQLGGADQALSAAAVYVTDAPPDDLDGLYAQTIGVAAVDAGAEYAATAATPAPQLVDHGDATDGMRRAVLGYLPQPDTPIGVPFRDPPALPGGFIRSGGWEGEITTPPGQPPDLETAVRASIRYLYVTLLGREPDQGGWDHWTREVIVNGHTVAWVREQILASDEYRRTHGG